MNSWCVGNVADMTGLFRMMDTFNEDISGWDTSSVTTMWDMFYGATSFNGNLSAWNTVRVVNICKCHILQWKYLGMEYIECYLHEGHVQWC